LIAVKKGGSLRWKCQNALHNRCHLELYYKILHSIKGVLDLEYQNLIIQFKRKSTSCIVSNKVFSIHDFEYGSHILPQIKNQKKMFHLEKNILLLNIYNFENIFCNFLMIKKRQECNNSTVYRTRIENILVTQFEVFFWKIKLVGQIEEFNKKCHFAGHFSLFDAHFRNFHYFFYHTSFNTIWHFKSNKTYFFQYLLVNNYFDMFTINMIKVS